MIAEKNIAIPQTICKTCQKHNETSEFWTVYNSKIPKSHESNSAVIQNGDGMKSQILELICELLT